jgi:hypothetical protein
MEKANRTMPNYASSEFRLKDVDLHGSCSTSTSTRDKTFLMIGAICPTPVGLRGVADGKSDTYTAYMKDILKDLNTSSSEIDNGNNILNKVNNATDI